MARKVRKSRHLWRRYSQIRLVTWAFTTGAGGGNRTLTVSLGTAQVMGLDDMSTPGGPTGPNSSPSQQAQTSASTDGAAQPGNAAIQLTSAVGPDSRNVLVRGSRFGANEEVVLSVDGTQAKRLQTDSSGAFTASLTVPFSKSSFIVRADGGRVTGRPVGLSRSRATRSAGRQTAASAPLAIWSHRRQGHDMSTVPFGEHQ